LFISCGGAWTHVPLVAAARGGDAPPLFLESRWPPLQFLDFWGSVFVIFTCWNMDLNYC
jgi:hypothetical protein